MKKIKRKKFKHLDQFDRDRIEALLKAGHLQKEIAEILKVDKGTISREIKKHKRKNGYYDSLVANHKALVSRLSSKYQGMKIEKCPELRKIIIKYLEDKQSPDAIAGRIKEDKIFPCISTKSIYRWLYSAFGQGYCRLLCTKRYNKKKQKRKSKREMISDRISFELRPKEGIHAEGDLFVSSKNSNTQRSGAVIVIPEAKLILGTMIPNKRPSVMTEAVRSLNTKVNINDILMDNGIENRDHKNFGIPAYFCDPHSPWQKPHVEQAIGILRRWFIKKKTNLDMISEEELQSYLHVLNNKWRKSLGYKSAYEVAIEKGILKTKISLSGNIIINQKSCISV